MRCEDRQMVVTNKIDKWRTNDQGQEIPKMLNVGTARAKGIFSHSVGKHSEASSALNVGDRM